jgi:hypothetical protein
LQLSFSHCYPNAYVTPAFSQAVAETFKCDNQRAAIGQQKLLRQQQQQQQQQPTAMNRDIVTGLKVARVTEWNSIIRASTENEKEACCRRQSQQAPGVHVQTSN